MSEKKKYNYMEIGLQTVMKKSISLPENDTKINNGILVSMTNQVIAKAKENPLFKLLYQRNFYGGSYYDGLKIEKPEEYDLDLLMTFPKNTEVVIAVAHDLPGFVSVKLKNSSSELTCILDGEYLNPRKVLKWMEGVFTKVIQQFPLSGTQNIISIDSQDYFIKICKSGPAFTVKLTGIVNENHINLDVDLVPCFIFDEKLWPSAPFRQNTTKDKPTFFIVPKIPKNLEQEQTNHSWRLSFQEQERVLMNGCLTFKPSMKLLKKLRDKLQMKAVSSYFIKTVFLWQVDHREASFWENSLSYVFMEMLNAFTECMAAKKIPYFWNSNNNLIASIPEITLTNYSNRLKNIINEINKTQDPYVIASYCLPPEEVEQLRGALPANVKQQPEAQSVNGSRSPPREKNNEVIKVKSSGKVSHEDYNTIIGKLESLQTDSHEVAKSLQDLRQDNKQLLEMMIAMTDKLSVLEMKCSYLENQYNRP